MVSRSLSWFYSVGLFGVSDARSWRKFWEPLIIFIVLLGCNHDKLGQRQLKQNVNCGISLKLDGDAILRAPEFVCFSSIHRAWSEVQNEFRSEFPTKKFRQLKVA